MSLDGKTVVVTGASRGLGRAIAGAFLKRGAIVHGTGRDGEAIAETEAAFGEFGDRFFMHSLEVTDEAAVVEFIGSLETIDVLVNNAGIARGRPLLETPTEEIRQTLEVNTIAPFVFMREALKKMIPNESGLIINIASMAAVLPIGDMAPYAASKHALLGLGNSVARAVHKHKIRVTTYCPGCIDTTIMGQGNPDSLNTDDLADHIVYLASLPPYIEVHQTMVESVKLL